MAYNAKYNKYKEDYSKNNYDRIQLVIPKGQKEEIKIQAESVGESLNAFIYRAIVERMQKLTTKPAPAPAENIPVSPIVPDSPRE